MSKENLEITQNPDSWLQHMALGYSLTDTAAAHGTNVHGIRGRFYRLLDPGGNCGPKSTEKRYVLDKSMEHFGFTNLLEAVPYDFSLNQARYLSGFLAGVTQEEARTLFGEYYAYQLHYECEAVLGLPKHTTDPQTWHQACEERGVYYPRFTWSDLGEISYFKTFPNTSTSFESDVLVGLAQGKLAHEIALRRHILNAPFSDIEIKDIPPSVFSDYKQIDAYVKALMHSYPGISYPQLIQLCRIATGHQQMGPFERDISEVCLDYVTPEIENKIQHTMDGYTDQDVEQLFTFARSNFHMLTTFAAVHALERNIRKPNEIIARLPTEFHLHPDAFRNQLRIAVKKIDFSETEFLNLLGSAVLLKLNQFKQNNLPHIIPTVHETSSSTEYPAEPNNFEEVAQITDRENDQNTGSILQHEPIIYVEEPLDREPYHELIRTDHNPKSKNKKRYPSQYPSDQKEGGKAALAKLIELTEKSTLKQQEDISEISLTINTMQPYFDYCAQQDGMIDGPELAQLVFLKLQSAVLRGTLVLGPHINLKAYIKTVAKNALIDSQKGMGTILGGNYKQVIVFSDFQADDSESVITNFIPTGSSLDPTWDHIAQNDRSQELHEAIKQLDLDHREILLLIDIEGFSYEETTQMLALPLGTVKSRLFRARATLKKLLENSEYTFF